MSPHTKLVVRSVDYTDSRSMSLPFCLADVLPFADLYFENIVYRKLRSVLLGRVATA